MKHRGVYWRKQSKKFVVSFKSNGKAKTYGLFASFDDAVKRAEEVWPTLPIANRSQRVCDNCCVRMSNQLFDWEKSTCKTCWKKLKADPWSQWAKAAATKLGKYSRRRCVEIGWVKWAKLKRIGICNRPPASTAKRTKKVATTWDQWCVIERVRSSANTARRMRSGWDRKTKQWTNGLIRRERDRLRRMNCEN